MPKKTENFLSDLELRRSISMAVSGSVKAAYADRFRADFRERVAALKLLRDNRDRFEQGAPVFRW